MGSRMTSSLICLATGEGQAVFGARKLPATPAHSEVPGRVRLRLFKGSCLAVSRTSPYSLYRHDLATFGEDGVYDQKDAAGFNNLWALPTRVVAAVRRETASPAPTPEPVASE